MQVLPEYLKKTQYRSPVDTSNGPFQMAFNTSMPLFVWLGEHPENLQAAIGTMSGQRTDQLVWMAEEDLFPRSDFQLSEDDLARERTLVVDVGGGGGQQSITFRRSQPQLRGRVVLQDLQPTLDSIDSASRQQLKDLAVDIQGHDFFTPQPEKGAKVYYIRNILHDWPDDKCLIILKHLRDAMKSDSVLIIDEIVVNEDKINWKQFHYDIVMMACLAGEERTESHFETLLSSAGFKLRETRCYEDGNGDSFLICVPI
jgi:demethylsterigmatocystin 6-O-methyltransferase